MRFKHEVKYDYWRGQRHEDSDRVVEVILLRGKRLGIICSLQGTKGDAVRFSISQTGAKVLAKQIRQVLAGDVKQWRTRKEFVWSALPEDAHLSPNAEDK